MNIKESIKKYFKNKAEDKETGLAPEGVCPNCWGKQEWDGHFHELIRAKNVTPETDTYNNFIKEIVTKHIDGIVIKEDTYKCTTCNVNYNKQN